MSTGVSATLTLPSGTTVIFKHGSVLDFKGDAFVNAANEGCVAGFGIDEIVNRSGGGDLIAARKKLNGCKTGDAKCTASFNHTNTRFIIHAVGPVFRYNALKDNYAVDSKEAQEVEKKREGLLVSSYQAALQRAQENKVTSIGFCLLSAGVFRGVKSLQSVVDIACETLISNVYSGLVELQLFAYTQEEANAVRQWTNAYMNI